MLSTLSQRRLEVNTGSFAKDRTNGPASRLTAGDCNHIGRMRRQNQYQHLVLNEVDDTSRIVARLDRKRLGQDTLASKWNFLRGVFDKQTRRKPLVFAADAVRYGI